MVFGFIRLGAEVEEANRVSEVVDRVIAGRDESEVTVWHPIARLLRDGLRPVEPSPEFLEALRLQLIAAADQRGAAPVEGRISTGLLIGAASLLSAAAVVAYLAHQRAHARAA
ncbi:MAG: hypothetical protein FJ033_16205 [Chloroflexi bacterium]|nr:hypothetical protein [Chloroflexota bacterium]